MDAIISCLESLRTKLDRHRRDNLKEVPTRTIFLDPLLQALGWEVRDPDEVELEYPIIDGKSVDYALKINRKPVLFIEAKPLNDPLTDVKAITQVVGYATNTGVEWCVLTNGVTYKVYRSTEKAEAPEKLLFKVSIDPKETKGMTLHQIAEQFARFSRESMESHKLDEIGEQIFTTGKVRRALDKLFMDPPSTLIKLIRSIIGFESITPKQVRAALKRLWGQEGYQKSADDTATTKIRKVDVKPRGGIYDEEHHTKGKPQEVIELFRTLDKFCRELDPQNVRRRYLAKYVAYSSTKSVFVV